MHGVMWLIVIGVGVVGVVAWIAAECIAFERRKHEIARRQLALKEEMVQRGMSVEEIERVIRAGAAKPEVRGEEAGDRYALEGPATCDVVAQESDGDWQRAILLRRDGDSWLVHYVGHDVDDNEWVGRDRIRFPSSVAFDEAGDAWPEDYNASEATVEWGGEWYPAYVLMHLDDCYVHYIGHDWSENEWVAEGRVRFSGQPATPRGRARSARSRVGAPAKPAPVELEV
jgi:hypothetical protein